MIADVALLKNLCFFISVLITITHKTEANVAKSLTRHGILPVGHSVNGGVQQNHQPTKYHQKDEIIIDMEFNRILAWVLESSD